MSRRLISSGSPFEKTIGYSRAVVAETPAGRFVWVAGTTGYDYAAMRMPEDVGEQTRNTFATIAKALAEAGLSMADVVRARYILTDKAYKDAFIAEAGRVFGDIRPAATMIIADLMEPAMKVEIEVDAFRAME